MKIFETEIFLVLHEIAGRVASNQSNKYPELEFYDDANNCTLISIEFSKPESIKSIVLADPILLEKDNIDENLKDIAVELTAIENKGKLYERGIRITLYGGDANRYSLRQILEDAKEKYPFLSKEYIDNLTFQRGKRNEA